MSDRKYAVCKLNKMPERKPGNGFWSLTVTDNEISLICGAESIPADAQQAEPDYMAFYIDEPLEFSMVGILAKIAGLLASENIPIFCLSTYLTDYIFIRDIYAQKAKAVLSRSGYEAECIASGDSGC